VRTGNERTRFNEDCSDIGREYNRVFETVSAQVSGVSLDRKEPDEQQVAVIEQRRDAALRVCRIDYEIGSRQ
jgi:hypothetical protein